MSIFQNVFKTIVAVVFCVFIQQANAGETEKRFYIEEVTVKPSQIGTYYQAVPKVIEMMKAYDYKFASNVITTNDGRFMWFTPAPQFAVIDDMLKQREAIFSKLTATQQAVFADMTKATLSQRSYFAKLSPSLSFFSAEDNKEARYFKVDAYSLKPGTEQMVEALGKKYIDLHDKLGVAKDYSVYKSSIGLNNNQIFVVRYAKDAVELAQKVANYEKTIQSSSEGRALRNEFAKLIVTMTSYSGNSPKGFSYVPSKKVASL